VLYFFPFSEKNLLETAVKYYNVLLLVAALQSGFWISGFWFVSLAKYLLICCCICD